jgi:hypothetical protein
MSVERSEATMASKEREIKKLDEEAEKRRKTVYDIIFVTSE